MTLIPRPRAPDDSEPGFTLVELLVVILIIAILSAIAIPVFLNQRRRAADAAAQSDLQHLARFEELYLTETDSYGTMAGMLAAGQPFSVTRGVTVTVVRYDSSLSYCLSARHASSVFTWYFDSLAGGVQPKGSPGCPLATAGAPGDSMTG